MSKSTPSPFERTKDFPKENLLLVLGSGKAGRRFDGFWNRRRRELFFARALA